MYKPCLVSEFIALGFILSILSVLDVLSGLEAVCLSCVFICTAFFDVHVNVVDTVIVLS